MDESYSEYGTNSIVEIVTLSDFAKGKGHTMWHEGLEFSDVGSQYLLISKHYSNLWLPALHLVFPMLDAPKERNSFHSISEKMGWALDLRNRVAHYNFYKFLLLRQRKPI